ncbi:MAG: hypothetical protein ACKOD9_07245, partial [Rubrivivax sp.]
MTDTLTLKRPDDWHLHVRDGAPMAAVVPHTARHFGRDIIMPNLKPPVTTAAQALAYRERILAAVPAGLTRAPDLLGRGVVGQVQRHQGLEAQAGGHRRQDALAVGQSL